MKLDGSFNSLYNPFPFKSNTPETSKDHGLVRNFHTIFWDHDIRVSWQNGHQRRPGPTWFFLRVSVQNAGNAAHTWLRHARKGAHAYVLHEWMDWFWGKKIQNRWFGQEHKINRRTKQYGRLANMKTNQIVQFQSGRLPRQSIIS